ncbi:MAG: 5-formyltetrahydrofolate cyclo-ligase [Myxococcales bacterium]|nr:5-formyltetrahydrofolate cyclo-ligase [Myxococcales bacterium]
MADPDFQLDPEHLAALSHRAKRQIRQRMRATRQAYPSTAVAARSAKICERLLALPILAGAKAVASFAPLLERREVDLRPLDEALRHRGVALYYPFMDPTPTGYRTGFRKVERPDDLVPRQQPFAEPPPDAPEARRGDIDVVLVPALAVAADGHRVGYGMGYYDATLPDVVPPAISVVVAFDFQLLTELPHEAHDRACDWVVTDAREIDVRGGVPSDRR